MAPSRTASMALITKVNAEDLNKSKAFHATTYDERHHADTFVNKLTKKDGEVQTKVYTNYMDNWKSTDQPENEQVEDKKQRATGAKYVANAYYDMVTDFYEYAWGTSFHFCRFYKGEPFAQAIARHEHYLAGHAQIKSTDRVLDVGCGVGGPAREIARFTGAHVTGLNNNDYQVLRASRYAKACGLSEQTEFVKGDFMNMPFPDNHFDVVYAIEATVHASSLEVAYAEIFRVLKPGGKFVCYEWLMTDEFDPENVEHVRIVRGIEVGNGVARLDTFKGCLTALDNVGYKVQEARDIGNYDEDEVKWYYPLEGDLRKAQCMYDYLTVLRTSAPGRLFTTAMVRTLETLRLAAPGSTKVSKILQTAADSLVESAILKIFTPMYFFVAVKPAEPAASSSA